MSDGTSELTPAGWYPDPDSPGIVRWWDGNAWTSNQVASGVFAGSINVIMFILLIVAIVVVLAYNFG